MSTYEQGVSDTIAQALTLLDEAMPDFSKDPASYFKTMGAEKYRESLEQLLTEYRKGITHESKTACSTN